MITGARIATHFFRALTAHINHFYRKSLRFCIITWDEIDLVLKNIHENFRDKIFFSCR